MRRRAQMMRLWSKAQPRLLKLMARLCRQSQQGLSSACLRSAFGRCIARTRRPPLGRLLPPLELSIKQVQVCTADLRRCSALQPLGVTGPRGLPEPMALRQPRACMVLRARGSPQSQLPRARRQNKAPSHGQGSCRGPRRCRRGPPAVPQLRRAAPALAGTPDAAHFCFAVLC